MQDSRVITLVQIRFGQTPSWTACKTSQWVRRLMQSPRKAADRLSGPLLTIRSRPAGRTRQFGQHLSKHGGLILELERLPLQIKDLTRPRARFSANLDSSVGLSYTGSTPSRGRRVGWMQSQSDIWCYALTHDILVRSLKSEGLLEDIILTVAEDSQLNARVIVDGNSRAVALAVMLMEDRGVIGQLLASRHRVQMLKLRSIWAHVVYPYDFINLCASVGAGAPSNVWKSC